MDVSKLFKVIDGKVCISSAGIKTVWGFTGMTLQNYVKQGLEREQIGWYQLLSVIQFMAEKKELQQVTVKSRLHNEAQVRGTAQKGTVRGGYIEK
ncbi:hypothetical protein [Paenibacillus melissococcoides]|uniref:hypothetical protein n=1 Tax=Paenibacillus melissococcoides TaxID=2912268 RepID=UPI0021C329B5|nr:hypothetical protein [Paenibacillus melissococcoides]CAH8719716.1 hypothetical protein HTL2_005699 [Paenibacillus melissococcoides]